MRTIDLNADLGELDDGSLDAAVMPFISSCNIACGAHAGSPESMRRTLRLAMKHGVAIGAHPGYPDRENFGRVSSRPSIAELETLVREQVLLLKNLAEEEGASVRHVKLHGALYNDLAFDYDRSLVVAKTLAAIDPETRFIVFSGSETARAAEDAGLVAVHEVFADRAYTADGKLVPRSEPGAVLHDEAACLAQAERFVGGAAGLLADSICVHGDNPAAIQFVSRLRAFFKRRTITLAPAGALAFAVKRLGEHSALAQLPPRVAKSTHRRIRALWRALARVEGVTELTPCYAELKIDYDPATTSFERLAETIARAELDVTALPAPRRIEVPVRYDGPDLARVARRNGLTEQEVVERHAARDYLIYMLGFSPGFAYLGGLDPQLATPRLETPRVSVPAGSVGIAGHQTGVYPVASPGGWNLIGRTPLQLFDPAAARPFLFEPGDEARFVPIDEETMSSFSAEAVVNEEMVAPDRFIQIIEPGMYTTVQDRGRFGFLQYGLPPSGAMDRALHDAANAALGNDPAVATLEATGTMPVLEVNVAVRVAVAYVDRLEILEASAGERLVFDRIRKGYRAYVAFAGGVNVPSVMGSRSTYVPAKLGGFAGRPSRAGDRLPLSADGARAPVAELLDRGSREADVIRVLPGPEADWFDADGLHAFLSSTFRASGRSDRTGVRLDGPRLSFRADEQMVSAGLAMGTIQVPPSGQPIIMMADHPTTGGYPRIGRVVEEDWSLVAQLKPGDQARFREERFRS